jgi:hypothetical protein
MIPDGSDQERADHHAFTISGGPFGHIAGTHVFPRSAALGVLFAKLLETTDANAAPYAFSNVSVDPGGYYRGGNEIVLPINLPRKNEKGSKRQIHGTEFGKDCARYAIARG